MAENRGASQEKKIADFKTRPGFSWKGLMPNVDPQDLPEDTPRQLTNVRLAGGRIESRGGQRQVSSLSGAVTGMYDYRPGHKPLILVGQNSNSIFCTYDPTQNPMVQKLISISASGGSYEDCLVLYGDDFYFSYFESGVSVKDSLYKLRLIKPPFGIDSQTSFGANPSIKVWTPPGSYTRIMATEVYDGHIYISVTNDTNDSSAVYRYDGTTATLEITFTRPMGAFGKFRELLLLFNNGDYSINSAKVRNKAGVWSDVAVTGAFVYGNQRTRSYKDVMYIVSGRNDSGSKLFTFNGTSFTDVSVAAGITTGTNPILSGIEIANGYLYYAWGTADDSFIGRFDGTTWEPTYKSILGDGNTGPIGRPESICIYNGSLHVTGVESLTPVVSRGIYFSPGENISGTWGKVSAMLDPVVQNNNPVPRVTMSS